MHYTPYFIGYYLILERVKGIEPSSQAWEAHVLPLNHTRIAGNLLAGFARICNFCLHRAVTLLTHGPGGIITN